MSWPDLAEQAWLVPPAGSEARAWFDQQLHRRGIAPPATLLALRDISLPLGLSADLGACRLLARSLLGSGEGQRYRRLAVAGTEEGFDRVVGLIWRGKGYLSPTAEWLMRLVDAAAGLIVGEQA